MVRQLLLFLGGVYVGQEYQQIPRMKQVLISLIQDAKESDLYKEITKKKE